MKLFITTTLLLLMPGCAMFGSKDPDRNFPNEIKPQLYGSLNEAENIIKSVGIHKVKDKSVTFKTRPGEKLFSGIWGWKAAELNMWVVGLTSQGGRLVQVAYKPGGNPFAIHWPTVLHEFGHHWLLSGGVGGHPHQYDRHFDGWKRSRAAQGQSVDLDPIDGVIILTVEYLEVEGLQPAMTNTMLSVTYEYQGETFIACGYIAD